MIIRNKPQTSAVNTLTLAAGQVRSTQQSIQPKAVAYFYNGAGDCVPTCRIANALH